MSLFDGANARWQVSRRNSYSDRDMFEGGEDEEDVPMKVKCRYFARSWILFALRAQYS